MPTIVDSELGYVNLDHVKKAKNREGGKLVLEEQDGGIDVCRHDVLSTIVTIIPVTGRWTCLIPFSGQDLEDGEPKYYHAPVIAWGLTAYGITVPITPFDPCGVKENYALMVDGDPRVFAVDDCIHNNLKEWIASLP